LGAGRHGGFTHHGERLVASSDVRGSLRATMPVFFPAAETFLRLRFHLHKCVRRAFAQILGKFHFFQLLENLQLIQFDYRQKLPEPANVAFNAAC
jgi:hypothetical protein